MYDQNESVFKGNIKFSNMTKFKRRYPIDINLKPILSDDEDFDFSGFEETDI